jgi:hypothetical protein
MPKKTSSVTDRGLKMRRIALGLVVAVLWAQGISAQYTQQGAKLVGTGSVGAAVQGCSVAVSADGDTAVVGGYWDNNHTGAAWVFTRSGGVWTQQGGKLVGTGAVGMYIEQGTSVAISDDGNTAIVGGPGDSPLGAAWVFTRSGGVWTQQGSKLVGTGAVSPSPQGSSVAISGDGDTAILGAYGDDGNNGAAWVFTRSGGVWTQQGSKLIGTGAVGASEQGSSVALSANGNTAVVGGPNDNAAIGAAWVFTRSSGVWTQQGGKLVGAGFVGSAAPILQGYSVAISGDGDTAVVGGPGDSSSVGAAWVFTRSGGVWTQQGGKLVGTYLVGGVGEGLSVGVSGDGNTAIVGGPGDFSLGGAWVFTRSGGVWTQLGDKLVGTGAVGMYVHQGTSVAISDDGDTAVLGGTSDNSGVGAAWVFVSSATQLALVQQPTDAVSGQDIAPAVTVQLEDSGGDPVAQAGVTIAMSLSSGTGTLSGTLSQATDASGLASFNDLSIDLVGSKELTASSGSLTAAVSDSFMITAGAAAIISATGGNPQGALINTQFSQPLEVTVTDASGNPLSGVAVTFTEPASGPSAGLSNGGSATTDADGRASVTATANGIAGGPYLVTAAAGTLEPVAFSLTNQQEAENAIPMLGGAGLLGFALLVLATGMFALRWWRVGS